MQDFEQKIQDLESEITALKTNAKRNGASLRTAQHTATFQTRYQVDSPTSAHVVYFTRATIEPLHDNPILFSVSAKNGQTLPEITQYFADCSVSTGYGFYVVCEDVIWTVGTYNYSVELVITATDDFTITTERVYL